MRVYAQRQPQNQSLGLAMFLNHFHPKIAKNFIGKTQCVPLLGHKVLKKARSVPTNGNSAMCG